MARVGSRAPLKSVSCTYRGNCQSTLTPTFQHLTSTARLGLVKKVQLSCRCVRREEIRETCRGEAGGESSSEGTTSVERGGDKYDEFKDSRTENGSKKGLEWLICSNIPPFEERFVHLIFRVAGSGFRGWCLRLKGYLAHKESPTPLGPP